MPARGVRTRRTYVRRIVSGTDTRALCTLVPVPRRALVVPLFVLTLAGCGSPAAPKGTPRPTASATPTLPPLGVEVVPATGGLGTEFELTARGFKSGEAVTFEVDFPDGHTSHSGKVHVASVEGIATSSWRATSGNPAGDYKVVAGGNRG